MVQNIFWFLPSSKIFQPTSKEQTIIGFASFLNCIYHSFKYLKFFGTKKNLRCPYGHTAFIARPIFSGILCNIQYQSLPFYTFITPAIPNLRELSKTNIWIIRTMIVYLRWFFHLSSPFKFWKTRNIYTFLPLFHANNCKDYQQNVALINKKLAYRDLLRYPWHCFLRHIFYWL